MTKVDKVEWATTYGISKNSQSDKNATAQCDEEIDYQGLKVMMREIISSVSQSAWRIATLGMKTSDHMVRYSMYKALENDPRCQIVTGPVLSISHSTQLAKRLGASGLEIIEANYPDCKINELPFPDNTFGAVVSDQVFEHIECLPSEAVREVYRVS